MQLGKSQNMNLEQGQQLALNAGLLQSLEIFRLPMQDLAEFLLEQTYENPLLELGEPPALEESHAQVKAEDPHPTG